MDLTGEQMLSRNFYAEKISCEVETFPLTNMADNDTI